MSRPPVLIPLDGEAPQPDLAPPVPDLEGAADGAAGQAMQTAARLMNRQSSRLGRFAFWAISTLLGFMISVAIYDFVAGLLSRNSLLGSVALALTGAVILALLALALREMRAFLRLGRLDHLHEAAAKAVETGDLKAAKSVIAGLKSLYAGREDQRWALARLAEREAEVFDADALVALGERELMGTLDQLARRQIEASVRRVSLTTAFVPLALLDVVVALWTNFAMIRAVAVIYGGRSGFWGSMRLLKRVFSHLIATGAMALGDDLIGSVAGGGMLSKLSRRFGEGVINGALTARVGIAAMEVCRPMPFGALPSPKVSNLLSRALAGVLDEMRGLSAKEAALDAEAASAPSPRHQP